MNQYDQYLVWLNTKEAMSHDTISWGAYQAGWKAALESTPAAPEGAASELPIKTWRERAEETEFDSLTAADCLALADKEIKDLRAALSSSTAPQPSQVAVKIDNTDQARQFLLAYMREHFTDKTFGEYILTKLAGDFAWNLASAISSRGGVDHA